MTSPRHVQVKGNVVQLALIVTLVDIQLVLPIRQTGAILIGKRQKGESDKFTVSLFGRAMAKGESQMSTFKQLEWNVYLQMFVPLWRVLMILNVRSVKGHWLVIGSRRKGSLLNAILSDQTDGNFNIFRNCLA